MFTCSLRRSSAPVLAVASTATLLILGGVVGMPAASAAQPTVGLGTDTAFAVLAGQTVTNTGPSVISGSLGLSPGNASSITGFPPGIVHDGTQHAADGVALQAKADLTTAYNSAAGRTPVTVVSADLGGQNLAPGVYQATSSMGLTGTVTLNGQNDANSVFIFQAGSTLTTASASRVSLINGAQACNVFWQVGSSATIGSTTAFVGNVLALTSATLNTGATVTGRILARNGAVTLDSNTITAPICSAASTTATTATTTPGGGSGRGKTPGGGGLGGGSTSGGVPGGGLGSGVVPFGSPPTGLGGASHSGNPVLVALGGVAVVGALLAAAQAYRRRRLTLASMAKNSSEPDGPA